MRRSIRKLPEYDPKSPFRVIDRSFFYPENRKTHGAEPAGRDRSLKKAKER
jgi:hypothetical protein